MRSAGVFHIEETMRGFFGRIYYFRHFTLHQFALWPPGMLVSYIVETSRAVPEAAYKQDNPAIGEALIVIKK